MRCASRRSALQIFRSNSALIIYARVAGSRAEPAHLFSPSRVRVEMTSCGAACAISKSFSLIEKVVLRVHSGPEKISRASAAIPNLRADGSSVCGSAGACDGNRSGLPASFRPIDCRQNLLCFFYTERGRPCSAIRGGETPMILVTATVISRINAANEIRLKVMTDQHYEYPEDIGPIAPNARFILQGLLYDPDKHAPMLSTLWSIAWISSSSAFESLRPNILGAKRVTLSAIPA
jgi:hypothetical protein